MDNAGNKRFIMNYRFMIQQFLATMSSLNQLKLQYDSLDLGNELTDGDFTGEDAGITKAQFVDAVGSISAVDTLLATGHYTNLFQVTK